MCNKVRESGKYAEKHKHQKCPLSESAQIFRFLIIQAKMTTINNCITNVLDQPGHGVLCLHFSFSTIRLMFTIIYLNQHTLSFPPSRD